MIEYSKDGEKSFREAAENPKKPELKGFFIQRASACATATSGIQSDVRRRGGDSETSTSLAGGLHRGWLNFKAIVTGKDDGAILNEVERGESHALKAHREARERLVKLGMTATDMDTAAYALVEKHLQTVQRNNDQVKVLCDASRARR